MLPPLASTPPAASTSNNSNNSNNSSNMKSDAAAPPSPVQTPRVEPLLVNHVRFTYAFKKNDAAKILPFLHKDVVLQTVDRVQLRGISAVLGYLVGPRMAKLSTHMHIKGSPTRSGHAQSKFIYEHGILFRQALYVEVIEWTSDHLAASITHVAVADGKTSKVEFAELSKAAPLLAPLSSSSGSGSSPLGASLTYVSTDAASDDEEPEHQHLADDPASAMKDVISMRRAKSCGEAVTLTRRLSRTCSSDSSARGSTCSSNGDAAMSDAVLQIEQIACADLAPIRNRKRVNPFVTIRKSPLGKSHWKSSVARHDAHPKWTNVPLELHAAQCESGSAILEISLWDFYLFKSVKVATAALVVADLFAHDSDEFTTSVQLERMELTDTAPPIQLTMTLRQKHPARSSGATASVANGSDAQLAADAAAASASASASASHVLALSSKSPLALVRELRWCVQDAMFAGDSTSRSTSMLLRAAFGLVLVWLISRINFEQQRA